MPRLDEHGFVSTVDKIERQLSIRIERAGATIYALDIYRGGSMGDDKLEFAVDQVGMGGGGRNGWAEPYFDKDAGVPMLKMFDLSVLDAFGGSDRKLTKEELFQALWSRIIKRLEA